jgi:hypothetical protein
MIGVKVTDGDMLKIAKVSACFTKAQEYSAARINQEP